MLSVYKNLDTKNDCYTTPKSAYVSIKPYVPLNVSICDPFYYDGKCGTYMKEVFDTSAIIHNDGDAFENIPQSDMIITNPPFTVKFKVLEYLVNLNRPFMCLLPVMSITTKSFRSVKDFEDFQFIFPNGRINFEKPDKKMKGAWFFSVWVCYKMNLDNTMIFAS